MTEITTMKKRINRINKSVTITLNDQLRESLDEIAASNQMNLSSLIRWMGAKVTKNPKEFGLLEANRKPKH